MQGHILSSAQVIRHLSENGQKIVRESESDRIVKISEMALECHFVADNIPPETPTLFPHTRSRPMGLSKNIAYRLRTLQEAAGLSQQEVADKADLSLSLITKMEQALGRPTGARVRSSQKG